MKSKIQKAVYYGLLLIYPCYCLACGLLWAAHSLLPFLPLLASL